MDTSLWDLYFQSVDDFGFEDSWISEDVLADKRIHAGSRHGSSNGEWARRLLVTEASEKVMVKACWHLHKQMPEVVRRKLGKDKVVDMATQAAAHQSFVDDATSDGVMIVEAQNEVEAAFVENDMHYCTALSCAIAEKKPGVSAKDLPLFRQFYLAKAAKEGKNNNVSPHASIRADAVQLEHKRFAILKEGVECDLEVREVYQMKLDDLDTRSYHTRMEHLQRRDQKAAEAAADIFDNHCYLAVWNSGAIVGKNWDCFGRKKIPYTPTSG